MQARVESPDTSRYAKCVANSKRVRFDVDRDVIRGRTFDFTKKFLPDGLSKVQQLPFLSADEKRLLSQIQGRTYANIFGLVERFIAAKILEQSREHWFGDQTALEALVRMGDEEIKHQEMFRRIEAMCAAGMPDGYAFLPDPNEVAAVVLSKSNWSVLGLTCHIELFVLAHHRASIDPDIHLSDLWKDVFLNHWKEESQHAVIDELEWVRENAQVSEAERDAAVDDLIALVVAVDGVLQVQARADADYFVAVAGRPFRADEAERLHDVVLGAYRHQYIVSGIQSSGFMNVLGSLISAEQANRIGTALAPLLG